MSVRAWQADTAGNLIYRMTENNFNQAMATAADLVIVEAEQIVPVGALDPTRSTRRAVLSITWCRRMLPSKS